MQLYSFFRSSAAYRVRIACNLKGLSYDTVPIHLQKCYADMGWAAGQFPVSEQLARETLSLPLDPMHTDAEIDRVISALTSLFARRRRALPCAAMLADQKVA